MIYVWEMDTNQFCVKQSAFMLLSASSKAYS